MFSSSFWIYQASYSNSNELIFVQHYFQTLNIIYILNKIILIKLLNSINHVEFCKSKVN